MSVDNRGLCDKRGLCFSFCLCCCNSDCICTCSTCSHVLVIGFSLVQILFGFAVGAASENAFASAAGEAMSCL
jgi:hypothetical protein